MLFENDVKMYGTQANNMQIDRQIAFENDVKMYGTQADQLRLIMMHQFENDVKMYGTQAIKRCHVVRYSLRMM